MNEFDEAVRTCRVQQILLKMKVVNIRSNFKKTWLLRSCETQLIMIENFLSSNVNISQSVI
jgi:hypothetical protein